MRSAERYYTSGEYWKNFENEDSSHKVSLLLTAAEKVGLSFPENFRGVEIGCGNGAFLIPLEQKLRKSLSQFQLVGYDIASTAIAMAADRMGDEQHGRLRFTTGSTSDINEKVDYIFLMDVLEHVENPYKFMRRLLGKASYIFLHLPLEASLFHAILGRPWRSYEAYKHLYFFSWDSAKILFKECQYKVVGYQFTGACHESIGICGSFATKAMRYLRYLAYKFIPNAAVVFSGGSVMVVLKAGVAGDNHTANTLEGNP